ncbi:nitrous oxide reductase accessory protein NosL [Shewanella eurypsychrophilus]|uniref:Nitrous oxide reductase accessory protein NosL n=1 Tax=Shewanella eurypsychrophilus TaxID=2593656 RepID=A0ABX6VB25_9GAMM|nr:MULTISPECIES: nitrous oxide reductase accessory protein NosL [Shewanella]QFU24692.1 nitrous oxide reductase accessory protein NosL [Shewanella sp. YLB-09]QPG59884.1 nitrous oxide reductase accessory protein NosL [Shewanella eurypsychrophilus]
MKKILLLSILLPLLLACGEETVRNTVHQAEAISDHERCHQCGMMITKYPGPKGQVFLKRQEHSVKFCSTRDMFSFALQVENQRQITGLFVHDVANTPWGKPQDDAFIDATKAWYVYGSGKQAVMGPAVASFSSKQSASQFAQEFGGAVIGYEQIDINFLEGE